MSLYEDLARRVIEAQSEAAGLRRDTTRIEALAQILRDAEAGMISIRRCAWCDRFDIGGEWLHVDAIGEGHQPIADRLLDRATHGICPDCFDAEERKASRRAGRAPRAS